MPKHAAAKAEPGAVAPGTFHEALREQARLAEPSDEFREFEGFVLRTVVETMLPKDTASAFGEGMAGDVWRSMMAERLGEEIAASGGVGIADLLAEDHARRVAAAAVKPGP